MLQPRNWRAHRSHWLLQFVHGEISRMERHSSQIETVGDWSENAQIVLFVERHRREAQRAFEKLKAGRKNGISSDLNKIVARLLHNRRHSQLCFRYASEFYRKPKRRLSRCCSEYFRNYHLSSISTHSVLLPPGTRSDSSSLANLQTSSYVRQ